VPRDSSWEIALARENDLCLIHVGKSHPREHASSECTCILKMNCTLTPLTPASRGAASATGIGRLRANTTAECLFPVRERESRLLLCSAKARKDSKEGRCREATRSEGDDLVESAGRALMRHGGRGRGVRGEGRR
jgi:hypothetical protein